LFKENEHILITKITKTTSRRENLVWTTTKNFGLVTHKERRGKREKREEREHVEERREERE
jgi:hypothetical protein